jgi:WhiB family redox-sensing transcriptional regulator
VSNRKWTEQAACKGMDTNLFFPDDRTPQNSSKYDVAKQVCAECPVKEECLTYAIENDIRVGMFGGMSRKQRRVEARMRKIRKNSWALND